MMRSSTTRYAATVVAPRLARSTLERFLGSSMSLPAVTTALLLTSELITNSVVHASIPAGDSIRMDLSLDEQRLRVSVSDAGGAFDRDHVSAEGGWGLVLVDQLSDRWAIEAGSPNTVWFELDR